MSVTKIGDLKDMLSGMEFGEAAVPIMPNIDDALSYMIGPGLHFQSVPINTPLERLMRGIVLRIRVADVFPGPDIGR